jgi:hypothetical protein
MDSFWCNNFTTLSLIVRNQYCIVVRSRISIITEVLNRDSDRVLRLLLAFC